MSSTRNSCIADGLKIALIGNMNNCNFSAMRYLRDLGVDAHLLKFTNEHSHFLPECDTWNIGRWEESIHQMTISNGGLDSLFASKRKIELELEGYDFYIGNGISPVLFSKMGRKLDLFLPYAEGVEFIVEHCFRWSNLKSCTFSALRKRKMENALRSSVRKIGTANMHAFSLSAYHRLGLNPLQLPLLPVYLEANPPATTFPAVVSAITKRMEGSSTVVLSHINHIWKNLPTPHFMDGFGKRNDWLIKGFAEFRTKSGDSNALLCFSDYGIDVAESKRLVDALDISNQVAWLPRMNRRDLLQILPHADVGAEAFAGMMWGGSGWEFLACGIPMLHKLDNPQAYATEHMPLPPSYNVASIGEIADVLLNNSRADFRAKGEACKTWFTKHQGYALARRYIDVIDDICDERGYGKTRH